MTEDMLSAIQRLHVMHQRALQTSVGHPDTLTQKRDFRHALAEFIAALGLDADTAARLHSAAMNPIVPQRDDLWDD